jgi:hypothetical protein
MPVTTSKNSRNEPHSGPIMRKRQVFQGVALAAAPVFVTTLLAGAQADQSQQVLAQVRQALGGEAKLSQVKTLSAEGTFRRVMGENEMNGDLELLVALPDKFQRIEQMSAPSGMPGPRFATTLNGTEAWFGPLGPMPPGMMVRMGGPGGEPAGQAGGSAQGTGGERVRREPRNPLPRIRGDYFRTMLALLPGSPATAALSYSYVGKAESPDGEADVIEATGPDDFTCRIFFDTKTHLPLMLGYKDRDPSQMRMRTFRMQPGESPEQRRQRLEEERKKIEAEGPPPPLVDMTWFVSDHRKVDGVMLPHRFTLQVADKPLQEWEITKFKVNAAIPADQFKRKTSE